MSMEQVETLCAAVKVACAGLLCGSFAGWLLWRECARVMLRIVRRAAQYSCPTPELGANCDILETSESGGDKCAACWMGWAVGGGGK